MPIPFILAGVALGAAAWGVKKGVDAKKGYKNAKELSNLAHSRFNGAKSNLGHAKQRSAERLEALGRVRFDVYENEIRAFQRLFQRLKNVELTELVEGDPLQQEGLPEFNPADIDFAAVDAVKAIVAGGGAGAAAGFLSFGAVGALASASTGTAISSLAGVAASNATLAWFGGGSLAAGGLGMAGGTIVLGGIVAGPVILAGGFVLDAHAKKKVEEAKATLAQAERAVSEMNRARAVAEAIGSRAQQLNQVTSKLVKSFRPMLTDLEQQVQRETDYRKFSPDEREQLMVTVATAKTLRHLLDVPVFDEDGQVTNESRKAVEFGEERLGGFAN